MLKASEGYAEVIPPRPSERMDVPLFGGKRVSAPVTRRETWFG
jgi:hypothetical protein